VRERSEGLSRERARRGMTVVEVSGGPKLTLGVGYEGHDLPWWCPVWIVEELRKRRRERAR